MSNILLVEDDTALRSGIQELLQESAYSVWTAENDQQAQKIRATAESSGTFFDLYILDIMLENSNGYTLCQKIRDTEDTPIIFLSALDDEDRINQGMNLGADAF
ncbi:MAG: response regulator, partial [Lachnospiraceae bacterium]|nr:response regulator [Lachnospiraceae bacterium]